MNCQKNLSGNLVLIAPLGVDLKMLLRSSSTPALNLNSFIGVQPKSELNSRRSVQFTQFLVAGIGEGKWVHHDLQPRFGRTLSEADLHSSLSSQISPSRLGLRSGSSSLDLCSKPSMECFRSYGLLDETLEEEFEDSDTQISIGFQSGGDPNEESQEKIMAAIGMVGGEGRKTSGRRLCEGTGVALVCDRVIVGCETETSSDNGGFGGEDGGGFSCGGRYGGRGGGFGSDSNNMDAYYKKMLQTDPGNPLLLTNYARFLQEVQHDLRKAEEYYGRAMLASPRDGDILSLYANLIWYAHKDIPGAESYFDQAVEAAPDDCNVLGSYAHFMWNTEDDEEDQDVSQQQKMVLPTYFGTATAPT